MNNNRQYWSNDKIMALLTIWAEDNVQQQINATCPNEDMMKYYVARQLVASRKLCIILQVCEKLKKVLSTKGKLHDSSA